MGGGEGEDGAVVRNTGSRCGGQDTPQAERSAFELGWPMKHVVGVELVHNDDFNGEAAALAVLVGEPGSGRGREWRGWQRRGRRSG